MVKIALQNSWPNVPNSAEAEWIRRALAVCDKLGFEGSEVVTSDDILHFEPDCVLVTHEYSPKLTCYPTLGLLWSPCSFYATDPIRRRSILSYDGYLCASDKIVEWLQVFLKEHRKRPLIMDGLFLPSSPDCGPAPDLPDKLAAMYAGIHWDGNRYKSVFHSLSQCVPMNIYGPPRKWKHVGIAYRGALPFDGRSVIEAIRASGIALCLHKPEHRAYNCPSMRLLEAAAAGALIISDDFAFPRYWFRDSILYVDAELPSPFIVDQIKGHVEWACEQPEAANQRARLFQRSVPPQPQPGSNVGARARVRRSRAAALLYGNGSRSTTPRTDGRIHRQIGFSPVKDLARALDSLAHQTHQRIAVTLAQFHPVEGIEEVITSYRPKFRWLRRHIMTSDGKPSISWWAGLSRTEADFFGVLDDHDSLHPNHVALILDYFKQFPEYELVYSGIISAQQEDGHYIDAINFRGPGGSTIAETRELQFFDPPEPARPENLDDCIQSNAWLCRSSVWNDAVLRHAGPECVEDLCKVIAERVAVGFTASPTVVRNWRSSEQRRWSNPGGCVDGSGEASKSPGIPTHACSG